jgi:hypothetical protein
MSILALIGMATMFSGIIDMNNEDAKDLIRLEWEKSKLYPRKKKKRVRKDLLIRWSFACYNPLKNL